MLSSPPGKMVTLVAGARQLRSVADVICLTSAYIYQ